MSIKSLINRLKNVLPIIIAVAPAILGAVKDVTDAFRKEKKPPATKAG